MVVFSEKLSLSDRKPTLSEINILYLIIVTTACHRCVDFIAFCEFIIFLHCLKSDIVTENNSMH